MDTPPRRGRAPSQGWPGRRVCRGVGTGRRLRREVPPPNHAHLPAVTVSLLPARSDGAQGLCGDQARPWGHRRPLRSANVRRALAYTPHQGTESGAVGQRSCPVGVSPHAGREADEAGDTRGTAEGGQHPGEDGRHTQSDRGPSSAADGKPAKETGGTFSPERGDRGHSGGSECQAEGTRRRGRPPRRAKQRRLGASGAALGGGTQLEDKAEPDAECPGGSAVLL